MSFTFDSKVSKRRVPDSDRRRAQISCDRCKTKRIRCARLTEDESCEACLDRGFTCRSTIARKKVAHPTEESLGVRQQALEALLRGIFPNENCHDTLTLYRLAAERGISMPNSDQVMSILQPREDGSAQRPIGDQTTTAELASSQMFLDSPSTVTQTPQSSVAARVPWPCNIDPAVQGAVTNLPEETCIPAPHGVAHYVGPASSFEFASAVRRLVAMRSETYEDTRTRQDRRSKLRADFANLKTSIALEPRIQAHPVSTVREQSTDNPVEDDEPTPTLHNSGAPASGVKGAMKFGGPTRGWLRELVPPKAVSDKLVKAFFERLHPNYVLFHRGTFNTRYDSIWQSSPVYRSERDPGWLCSLFMVFVFGAQLLEQSGLEDAAGLQRKYLKLVREKFHHLALTASLANVQALLLLQLYEHNAGERNTAWILLGQAARMAIALGMHREGTSHNFDAIERNTRRMVWFTLYSFEQYASLSLGRPTTIKALEVNIHLPDEAVLDGNDYPPDYLHHASILLDLTSKVRHFATAASPNCFDELFLTSMLGSLATISRELESWEKCLPQHLRPKWCFISPRHRRAVLLLHVTYHHISSVLTRPYLLCKVEHEIKHLARAESSGLPTAGPSITRAAQECIFSSVSLANTLHRLSSEALVEGLGWNDFFYVYHAMLVLCLDFLGRPHWTSDKWSCGDQESSDAVSHMIEMCQSHKLGPTFHILSQVAIQFAHIVGLAGDNSSSRQDSEQPQSRSMSQDASDGLIQSDNSGIVNAQNAVANQHDGFMPYAEPISGLTQFNSNDVFWDFFNVNGADPMDTTFNPTMQTMANGTFEDPFGYSYPAAYDRLNGWS